VKLLLDENLSRRLIPALQDRVPGSSQVTLLGLERSTDAELCEYAAREGFVLCSKDDDFQRLVAARLYRPKLILLAIGNATNDRVLEALLAAADRLERVLSQDDVGIAVIER
jgi:predicted nuclease of predicted toxin-antitoxin system